MMNNRLRFYFNLSSHTPGPDSYTSSVEEIYGSSFSELRAYVKYL